MIQRDMVTAMAGDCMRRKVKVRFVDFWPGFDPSSWSLCRILSKKYELVECSDPDYLLTEAWASITSSTATASRS